MYTFTDPKVVECLHRVINVYSKIGEHINILATATSLQFSILNSSSTVLAKHVVSKPLFTGVGTSKRVTVKARAADLIFKRLESEDVATLHLVFDVTRTGQEQLEIQLEYVNGIRKTFRTACLQTHAPPVDFDPIGPQPSSLECIPGVLKEAFASCETGADEVKVSFQHNLVNLLARRRGKVKNDTSILRSGLRTIINLQPETFRQITVHIPRQLELKLKEFRLMLGFFDQLGSETPILAQFHDGGLSTPVVFRGGPATVPGMSFVFKFMAKVSIPRVGDAGTSSLLKVGPQPDWVTGRSGDARDTLRHSDPALRHARREREKRLRRISAAISAGSATAVNSGSLSPTSSAGVPETDSANPNPEGQDENEEQDFEFDPAATEVGLTQGSAHSTVPGLFD